MKRLLNITKRISIGLLAVALFVVLFSIAGNFLWDRAYNNLDEADRPTPEELALQGIQTIEANGLEFAYLADGDPADPLVLLIHGFPDTAYTYQQILPVLADNGYYAVAYFQRGYYPTDIPADEDYTAHALGQDALELIKAFGKDEAVVIGHDWGASAAYAAANLAPEKVSRLVTIAIPHPSVIPASFETLQRAPHFIYLQFGFVSQWLASQNNFAYIDGLLAYWAPNWEMPTEDLDRVKTDFARPGRLKASLGYYASFFSSDNQQYQSIYNQPTTVPTLSIAGEEDQPLDITLFENMDSAISSYYKFVPIPVAGHFPHQEAHDQFIEELLIFLSLENPEN